MDIFLEHPSEIAILTRFGKDAAKDFDMVSSTAWVAPLGSTAAINWGLSMTIFSLAHTYAFGFVIVIRILTVGFIEQIMLAYSAREVCSSKAVSDVSHLLFSHAFHVLIVFLIGQESFQESINITSMVHNDSSFGIFVYFYSKLLSDHLGSSSTNLLLNPGYFNKVCLDLFMDIIRSPVCFEVPMETTNLAM